MSAIARIQKIQVAHVRTSPVSSWVPLDEDRPEQEQQEHGRQTADAAAAFRLFDIVPSLPFVPSGASPGGSPCILTGLMRDTVRLRTAARKVHRPR